uniref:Uncharacterized protein n=1 Tax=Anguilla anguilla TaxID=7936 RepID=A0A0E9PVL9_ANGAN
MCQSMGLMRANWSAQAVFI